MKRKTGKMKYSAINYADLLRVVQEARCGNCDGSGMDNDAEPGDMYINEWACHCCKGTGFKGGKAEWMLEKS